MKDYLLACDDCSVIEHPNIVLLKGICLNPPCIITEFMELGKKRLFCSSLVQLPFSCSFLT